MTAVAMCVFLIAAAVLGYFSCVLPFTFEPQRTEHSAPRANF